MPSTGRRPLHFGSFLSHSLGHFSIINLVASVQVIHCVCNLSEAVIDLTGLTDILSSLAVPHSSMSFFLFGFNLFCQISHEKNNPKEDPSKPDSCGFWTTLIYSPNTLAWLRPL